MSTYKVKHKHIVFIFFNYTTMQIMQLCNYANMQVCNYAIMQVCNFYAYNAFLDSSLG